MKRHTRIMRNVLAVLILVALLLPIGIVLAEDFGVYSTIDTDAGYVIGDPYQRHTFIAEGLHWVFYATDDAIYYTSSADADTWAAPTKFDDYFCNMSPFCCNASSFALWYDVVANYVDVAWMNVTGPNENIYYRMGNPVANGSITWRPAFVAVPKAVGLTYSHPSICDNTDDYPFIAYMVYNGSAYSGNVSADTSNTGLWGSATNSTISSSLTFNISADVFYPSVVPVSNDNISIMVVFDTGVDYLLAQNYAKYNVSTDLWTYPATATFPLPATSSIDIDDLIFHSEVAWSGNLSNTDDVFAVAMANDSVLGKYFWYDRYGSKLSPWQDDIAFPGYFYGSIGIRNALGDMAITAIEILSKVNLYNNDYDMTAQTWTGFYTIPGVDGTSWEGTQTDYDNAGTSYLGAIYYDNNVAYMPDLEYGCYGCSIITPIGGAGTSLLQIILPLLIALLVLILIIKAMPDAGVKGVIMAIALAAIVGAIAFQIVKAVVDIL
jgi:hypothetical protein